MSHRGFLLDLREATVAQLRGLDASQGARRVVLQDHIRLYDALLEGDGPGDDEQYRQILRALLHAGEYEWSVEGQMNPRVIQAEAERLLRQLDGAPY